MAVNSCSIVDLFDSPFVNALLANETGNSMPSCSWASTAPHATFEASVVKINCLLKLGNCSIFGDSKYLLSVSKAF